MNYTETEIDVIVADSFKELTYRQKKLLLAAHSDKNADKIKYSDQLIKMVGEGVYNKIREKFLSVEYRNGIMEGLASANVQAVTVKSGYYPEQLKIIPVPPLVLYARGNVQLLKTQLFAIVGSRKTAANVLSECKSFATEISSKMTVVTGIADGADSAAITGALETGNIICVLPGGHDNCGAPNVRLLKRAEDKGLSISEYPPEMPAKPYMFVMRNRLIAALSDGLLVVSAGEKSGALSSANFAIEYSKLVFAFPYGIGVATGKGCNDLIKRSALLCDSVKDVLDQFGFAEDYADGGAGFADLSAEEREIIEVLSEEGCLHAQKLADMLGKPLVDVLTTCSMLEINGIIVRSAGNTFTLIKN